MANVVKEKQHWDTRAQFNNVRKGQSFYTITPIPLYLKRRKKLLNLMTDELHQAKDILDFGCGDGWYVQYFNKHVKNRKKISGLDISPEMVKKAKQLNPKNDIYTSDSGVKQDQNHDLVYSIATFAHIKDESLLLVMRNIHESLEKKGKFILFEQVAPIGYKGETFHRRSISDYVAAAQKAGFIVQKKYLLDFRAHRFFERHIAKHYIKLCKGEQDHEKRLHANSQKFYHLLSSFFLMFDKHPVKEGATSGWGNAMIVFTKDMQ